MNEEAPMTLEDLKSRNLLETVKRKVAGLGLADLGPEAAAAKCIEVGEFLSIEAKAIAAVVAMTRQPPAPDLDQEIQSQLKTKKLDETIARIRQEMGHDPPGGRVGLEETDELEALSDEALQRVEGLEEAEERVHGEVARGLAKNMDKVYEDALRWWKPYGIIAVHQDPAVPEDAEVVLEGPDHHRSTMVNQVTHRLEDLLEADVHVEEVRRLLAKAPQWGEVHTTKINSESWLRLCASLTEFVKGRLHRGDAAAERLTPKHLGDLNGNHRTLVASTSTGDSEGLEPTVWYTWANSDPQWRVHQDLPRDCGERRVECDSYETAISVAAQFAESARIPAGICKDGHLASVVHPDGAVEENPDFSPEDGNTPVSTVSADSGDDGTKNSEGPRHPQAPAKFEPRWDAIQTLQDLVAALRDAGALRVIAADEKAEKLDESPFWKRVE